MQIKFSLILLFLVLTPIPPSFSQAIDSLFNLLEKSELAQEKVDLWNKISLYQQPIGGKEAAETALNLAKEINYPKGEADANYYLGCYNYLKENQDLAKAYMLKASLLYDSLNLQIDKAKTLTFLGEMKYFEKEYQGALNYYQAVEDIAISHADKALLAKAYQNKAYIYIDGLEDKQLGKQYLLACNSILEEGNLEAGDLLQNYEALAAFFAEMNQIDTALIFIQKGESILNKLDASPRNTYIKHSLSALKGSCYAKTGKGDTAKFFINQSLPYFLENENWYAVAWSYIDLSIIALNNKAYKESLSYAKKSMELDVTNYYLEDNIKLIRDAFKHLNQDSFYVYNEKYVAILTDTKNIKDINELQETIKKEALLKKEAELIREKKNSRNIVLGALTLALLYGGISFFYRKKTSKKNISTNPADNGNPAVVPQIKETEISLLKQKVDTIERSLLAKEMDLERQQSSIDNAAQVIKKIATNNNPTEFKKSIKELGHQLEHNLNKEKNWASFSQQFEQIHPDFFTRLRGHTSNLSIRETRLCAYGRLGMTNQEIAQILGIATNSVSKARHRLKKKMNLEKAQDLNQFLSNL